MNHAKEHLEKHTQGVEDRRRRNQDIRYRRISLALSGAAVLIALISLVITLLQLR